MDLQAAASRLVQGLDQRMSPSLYDAAWLLRLRDPSGAPCYPEYLEWLLTRQHRDGSWGSAIRYYHHDRVVCTLIAAVALAEIEPSPDNRRLTLRQDGKRLHVQLVSPPEATFRLMPAAPLPESPHPPEQNPNRGIRKFAIHLANVRDVQIAVRFTGAGP